MKICTVIAFGAFDPLHPGHEFFLQQAKSFGDYLLVVVARDSSIRAYKQREPYKSEEERLSAVVALPAVNEAILGNKTAHRYELLAELSFDVVALGYDQSPSEEDVRRELDARGKFGVAIVRCPALRPDLYKSTILRGPAPIF
ncbi:MAG: FAD synthase [Candidatus Andersenbacteria bacterium]|nr:FAD synthase [Candidatus Andersenbacteria bacterium]